MDEKEGKQLKPVSVNQSRADIEQDSFFEDFCSIVDRYEIPMSISPLN